MKWTWFTGAALLFLSYLVLGFHPIWDVDVFWHICAGRWIVENMGLPTTDIFSAVDPQRPWTTFQWLYEVICFGTDSAGGLTAVRALHTLVTTCALALLLVHLWRRQGPAAGLAALAVAAFLFADRLRVRPDAFNLLFVSLLLPTVCAPKLDRKSLAWIALISGLWANIHAGGALLAPILVGARLAGEVFSYMLRSRWEKQAAGGMRRALAMEAAAAGVTLAAVAIMPGFVRGTWQAFTMLGPSETFIPEWMTTVEFLYEHATAPHQYVAAMLPVAGLLLYALAMSRDISRKGWRKVPDRWRELACVIPLTALALLHVRFLWLGMVVWLLLLIRHRLPTALLVCASLTLIAVDGHYHIYQTDRGAGEALRKLSDDLQPGAYPEDAAQFLKTAGLKGRIFNYAPWGGYLLYELWPDSTVFTDGRGNFPPEVAQLLTMRDAPLTRKESFRKAFFNHPYEIIVDPAPFPLFDVHCADWLLVYHDQVATVRLTISPRNEANLDAAARYFNARGITGYPGPDREDFCAFQRQVNVYWAQRRIDSGERADELARLRIAAADGAPAATMALGALYFDLGHYPRCEATLTPYLVGQGKTDLNARFLLAMCHLADGRRTEALDLCHSMDIILERFPNAAARMPPRTRACFSHLRGYLEAIVPTTHTPRPTPR